MRTIAKIKFDVKGVESKTERNVPKPGVYPCKIVSCVDAKPSGKDRRLEVQYEITSGEYKGSKLFDYINLESEASRWKLRQFLEAVGIVSGKKESGTLDPDDIVGTALSVRTRLENSEQYGASARPATLMPLDADEDDEDDEDLSEVPDDEGEDDDDSGEDLTWSDLEEMDFDDLCELVEEEELEVETHKGKGKKKKPRDEDELRAEIAEELEIEQGDEDDEEDDDDGDAEEYDRDDLEAMDKEELAEAAEKLEVEFPDGKLTAKRKKAVIDAILEAQEGDDEDEEDEEDEDETPDYASMSPTELKALCKERELDTKGTKKVLIARLKKDDKPF